MVEPYNPEFHTSLSKPKKNKKTCSRIFATETLTLSELQLFLWEFPSLKELKQNRIKNRKWNAIKQIQHLFLFNVPQSGDIIRSIWRNTGDNSSSCHDKLDFNKLHNKVTYFKCSTSHFFQKQHFCSPQSRQPVIYIEISDISIWGRPSTGYKKKNNWRIILG